MSRDVGSIIFTDDLEVLKAGPLDARSRCRTRDALVTIPYPYVGMTSTVWNDPDKSKRGTYLMVSGTGKNISDWMMLYPLSRSGSTPLTPSGPSIYIQPFPEGVQFPPTAGSGDVFRLKEFNGTYQEQPESERHTQQQLLAALRARGLEADAAGYVTGSTSYADGYGRSIFHLEYSLGGVSYLRWVCEYRLFSGFFYVETPLDDLEEPVYDVLDVLTLGVSYWQLVASFSDVSGISAPYIQPVGTSPTLMLPPNRKGYLRNDGMGGLKWVDATRVALYPDVQTLRDDLDAGRLEADGEYWVTHRVRIPLVEDAVPVAGEYVNPLLSFETREEIIALRTPDGRTFDADARSVSYPLETLTYSLFDDTFSESLARDCGRPMMTSVGPSSRASVLSDRYYGVPSVPTDVLRELPPRWDVSWVGSQRPVRTALPVAAPFLFWEAVNAGGASAVLRFTGTAYGGGVHADVRFYDMSSGIPLPLTYMLGGVSYPASAHLQSPFRAGAWELEVSVPAGRSVRVCVEDVSPAQGTAPWNLCVDRYVHSDVPVRWTLPFMYLGDGRILSRRSDGDRMVTSGDFRAEESYVYVNHGVRGHVLPYDPSTNVVGVVRADVGDLFVAPRFSGRYDTPKAPVGELVSSEEKLLSWDGVWNMTPSWDGGVTIPSYLPCVHYSTSRKAVLTLEAPQSGFSDTVVSLTVISPPMKGDVVLSAHSPSGVVTATARSAGSASSYSTHVLKVPVTSRGLERPYVMLRTEGELPPVCLFLGRTGFENGAGSPMPLKVVGCSTHRMGSVRASVGRGFHGVRLASLVSQTLWGGGGTHFTLNEGGIRFTSRGVSDGDVRVHALASSGMVRVRLRDTVTGTYVAEGIAPKEGGWFSFPFVEPVRKDRDYVLSAEGGELPVYGFDMPVDIEVALNGVMVPVAGALPPLRTADGKAFILPGGYRAVCVEQLYAQNGHGTDLLCEPAYSEDDLHVATSPVGAWLRGEYFGPKPGTSRIGGHVFIFGQERRRFSLLEATSGLRGVRMGEGCRGNVLAGPALMDGKTLVDFASDVRDNVVYLYSDPSVADRVIEVSGGVQSSLLAADNRGGGTPSMVESTVWMGPGSYFSGQGGALVSCILMDDTPGGNTLSAGPYRHEGVRLHMMSREDAASMVRISGPMSRVMTVGNPAHDSISFSGVCMDSVLYPAGGWGEPSGPLHLESIRGGAVSDMEGGMHYSARLLLDGPKVDSSSPDNALATKGYVDGLFRMVDDTVWSVVSGAEPRVVIADVVLPMDFDVTVTTHDGFGLYSSTMYLDTEGVTEVGQADAKKIGLEWDITDGDLTVSTTEREGCYVTLERIWTRR